MNINDHTFPDYWERYLNQTLSSEEIKEVKGFVHTHPEWKDLVEDKRKDLMANPDKTLVYPHKANLLHKTILFDSIYRAAGIAASFLILFMLSHSLWKTPTKENGHEIYAEQSSQRKETSKIQQHPADNNKEKSVIETDTLKTIAFVQSTTTTPTSIHCHIPIEEGEQGIEETTSLVLSPLPSLTDTLEVVYTDQLVSMDSSPSLKTIHNPVKYKPLIYTQSLVSITDPDSIQDSTHSPCSLMAVLEGNIRLIDFAICVRTETYQQMNILRTTVMEKATTWRDKFLALSSLKQFNSNI